MRLRAASEADARRQLEQLPHRCGERSFPAAARRRVSGWKMTLVFSGTCPGCGAPREETFWLPDEKIGAPAPRPAPNPDAEGHELPSLRRTCRACEGRGETFAVHGDGSSGPVTCSACHGAGFVMVSG